MSTNLVNKLYFKGKGIDYFKVCMLNILLIIATLGLYYPWARTNTRKYLFGETFLNNNNLLYQGTGKEMFKGYIKVYLLVLIILSLEVYAEIYSYPELTFIISPLVIFVLIPLGLFGAARYRLSRTSFRGIFFSFKGILKEFYNLYLTNVFLTVITFGIYYSWMRNNITKYLISNSKYGNLRFDFKGNGFDFFSIIFIGYLLNFISLGIYYPFFKTNLFNFQINNTLIIDDKGQNKQLESTLKGSTTFKIMFVNLILGILTFGLAYSWIEIRMYKMYLENIQLPLEIDFNDVFQEADDYKNATGDDLVDVLDIGIDI